MACHTLVTAAGFFQGSGHPVVEYLLVIQHKQVSDP